MATADPALEEVQIGWKTVDASLLFDRYIAQPYWPERNLLINVAKQLHPKWNDTKKEQGINAALEKLGKTREEYNRALVRAERAFYTVNDKNPDQGDGEIIIPARQFLSFVNHASMKAPKAIPKIPEKGLTFRGIRFAGVEGFTTGKTKADAEIFSRFVKLEESNQRTLSESPYISDFTARATLRVSEAVISASNLRKLIEWGGSMLGIGAARPQGFGGFTVTNWDVR